MLKSFLPVLRSGETVVPIPPSQAGLVITGIDGATATLAFAPTNTPNVFTDITVFPHTLAAGSLRITKAGAAPTSILLEQPLPADALDTLPDVDWAAPVNLEAVRDIVANLLTAGSNVTLSQDPDTGVITITAAGGGTVGKIPLADVHTLIEGDVDASPDTSITGSLYDTVTLRFQGGVSPVTFRSFSTFLRSNGGTSTDGHVVRLVINGSEAARVTITGLDPAAFTLRRITFPADVTIPPGANVELHLDASNSGNGAPVRVGLYNYAVSLPYLLQQGKLRWNGAQVGSGAVSNLFPLVRFETLTEKGTSGQLAMDDVAGLTAALGTAGLTSEQVRDVIAAMLTSGTHSGVTVTYNDAGDTLSLSVTGGATYTDEQVRDVVGATLVAGANVTLTVNDAGDTITIASTASGGSDPTAYSPTNKVPLAGTAAVTAATTGGSFTQGAGSAVSSSLGLTALSAFTADSLVIRAWASNGALTLSLRTGSASGPVLGTVEVTNGASGTYTISFPRREFPANQQLFITGNVAWTALGNGAEQISLPFTNGNLRLDTNSGVASNMTKPGLRFEAAAVAQGVTGELPQASVANLPTDLAAKFSTTNPVRLADKPGTPMSGFVTSTDHQTYPSNILWLIYTLASPLTLSGLRVNQIYSGVNGATLTLDLVDLTGTPEVLGSTTFTSSSTPKDVVLPTPVSVAAGRKIGWRISGEFSLQLQGRANAGTLPSSISATAYATGGTASGGPSSAQTTFYFDPAKYVPILGAEARGTHLDSPAFTRGTTAARPTNAVDGDQHYDTDLNKPVWFDGTQWRDATGTIA